MNPMLGIILCFTLSSPVALGQTISLSGDTALWQYTITPTDDLDIFLFFDTENVTTEAVTELSWEVNGIPPGATVDAGQENPCAPAYSVTWNGEPGSALQVAGLSSDGGSGSECGPFVVGASGRVTFTAEQVEVSAGDFPVRFHFYLTGPGPIDEFTTISVTYRYRLDDGPEISTENDPMEFPLSLIIVDDYYCDTVGGDADSSGAVTPNDAQLVFESYLHGEDLSDGCGQCDSEDTTRITPGDAQAIFEVFVGEKAACDNWDFGRY